MHTMEICKTCTHARLAPASFGEEIYFCDKVLDHLCDCLEFAAPAFVLVRGHKIGCLDFYERDQTEFNRVWAYELAALDAAEDEKQESLKFWGQPHTARSA